MKKKVHEFKTIYGDYVTAHFVADLRDVAEDGFKMARMYRNDLLRLEGGLHHQDLPATNKTVDFWDGIITKCKEFTKCTK